MDNRSRHETIGTLTVYFELCFKHKLRNRFLILTHALVHLRDVDVEVHPLVRELELDEAWGRGVVLVPLHGDVAGLGQAEAVGPRWVSLAGHDGLAVS